MEPGLRGPERDPEGCRHLWQWHPEEVVHDDDRAPLRFEVAKRAIEEVPVGNKRRDVGARRGVQGREVDFDRPMPSATGEIEAGIDDQATEPGVEAIRIA